MVENSSASSLLQHLTETSVTQAGNMLQELIRQGWSPDEAAMIIQNGLQDPDLVTFANQAGITDQALELLGKMGMKLSEKDPEG